MNVPSIISCECADCPGASCACGCNAAPDASRTAVQAPPCTCGSSCACQATERGCLCGSAQS
jgi:hypothetical protein